VTYRLVHRPDLDATGYRMPEQIGDPVTRLDVVTFRLADPADEHEAALAVTTSRAAWESQGAPEELYVTLTTPTPTEEPESV
jgi:hypothetical protein